MLKRACICVAILSFLVVMGLPLAQASTERRIKVNVPFDFYMRDRVLSAGEYELMLQSLPVVPGPGARRVTADRRLVQMPDSGEVQVTLVFNQSTPP